jgi:methylated-DNA-[protein]-cysteine S-methyltransferase
MTLHFCHLDSPVGRLHLWARGDALVGVYFPDHKGAPIPDGAPRPEHPVLAAARRQLGAYFAGERREFDLPVEATGTAFQQAVWAALGQIPFGATSTYAALAAALGQPTAVRAVGAANGRNPLSILVPCHRVIGADGALTGYAGGVAAKRWLLDHERRLAAVQGRLDLGGSAHAPGQ